MLDLEGSTQVGFGKTMHRAFGEVEEEIAGARVEMIPETSNFIE